MITVILNAIQVRSVSKYVSYVSKCFCQCVKYFPVYWIIVANVK